MQCYIRTCRLRQEFKELARSPDGGITVSLPDDSNFLLWNAYIVAPKGSLYEGKICFKYVAMMHVCMHTVQKFDWEMVN